MYLIFFMPFLATAQYPDETKNTATSIPNNFSIENSIIYWKKIYEGTPLINHPNLNNGKATNCKISKCNGCSFFMGEEFNFDYTIDTKDNRYRIIAYNFRFKNSLQYNIHGIITDVKSNSLESFMIKKKNGNFRENNIAFANFTNLDDYLTSLFTPNLSKIQDDW